jgi:hypothetical protein
MRPEHSHYETQANQTRAYAGRSRAAMNPSRRAPSEKLEGRDTRLLALESSPVYTTRVHDVLRPQRDSGALMSVKVHSGWVEHVRPCRTAVVPVSF